MPPLEHLSGPEIGSERWRTNVVLLNGLKGDAKGTWTPRNGEPWWNKLSADLGGATILAYNVAQAPLRVRRSDETPLERHARDIVDDIAKRGILNRKTIFMAYSFGGILLKRVIVEISAEPDHYDARRINIAGLAFLAVPHKGSRWATPLLWFLRPFGTTHLKDVKPGSRTLVEVNRMFSEAFEKKFVGLPVVSVVETRRITVGSLLEVKYPSIHTAMSVLPRWLSGRILARPLFSVVVDEDSALLGVAREVALRTDACHLMLPWFSFEGAPSVLDKLSEHLRPLVAYDSSGEIYFKILTQRTEQAA